MFRADCQRAAREEMVEQRPDCGEAELGGQHRALPRQLLDPGGDQRRVDRLGFRRRGPRAADRIEIVASASFLVDRRRLGAMLDRYGIGMICSDARRINLLAPMLR